MSSRIGYHLQPQRKAAVKEYNASPKGKYQAHKLNAKTRNIEFNLTFEQWWTLWEPFWDMRGRGKGKYHMGRYGDTGPYSMDNVYLVLHEINCQDDKPRVDCKQGTKPTVSTIAEMLRLYKSGLSIRAVSRVIGCSQNTVDRHIRANIVIEEL